MIMTAPLEVLSAINKSLDGFRGVTYNAGQRFVNTFTYFRHGAYTIESTKLQFY